MADVLVRDAIKAFCETPNDMFKQLEALFDLTVERAIADERERCAMTTNLLIESTAAATREHCAKLAETFSKIDPHGPRICIELAAAIRKGE
jgi:hypothetical protein